METSLRFSSDRTAVCRESVALLQGLPIDEHLGMVMWR